MKEFLNHLDKPIAGAMAALEDAARMLKAMGYTQTSYGADATGSLHVLKKDGISVRLEVSVRKS